MKASELKKLSDGALAVKLKELTEETFNLRFRKATSQLTDHSIIRKVRRDVSRIKTIVGERSKA